MPKVELYLPFEVVGRVLGGIAQGVGDGIHVIAEAISPSPQPDALPPGVEVLPAEDQGMGDQPTEVQPTPQLGGMREYVVKDGEYLSDIAARELGRADRWREIMSINNLADSRKIKAGDTIMLPPG